MKLRNFYARMISIYKISKNNDAASLREIAELSSISKSSVQRIKVKQRDRIAAVGHNFFETEEGMLWLRTFIFSVIFTFGVQAGVGAETISLFLSLVGVALYVGISPSCIRTVKNKIRTLIDKYGKEQVEEVIKLCLNKELHLGGDETNLGDEKLLLLMELTSGFVFNESLVPNRTFETWEKETGGVLQRLKKSIRSFTSDAGKALLKLCKKYVGDNIMDLFHALQDIKRVFATKFHSKRSSLYSQLKKLMTEPLSSAVEQKQAIADINTKLTTLDKGQVTYRNVMFVISTEVHPFTSTSELKTSAKVKETLEQQLKRLRATAQACEIEDKANLLDRFERRIPACSQLNDLWHDWVNQSVACKTQDARLQSWAKEVLLPVMYWEEQIKKSKKKKELKNHYEKLLEQAKDKLAAHPLTADYLTNDWIGWARAMALKYQRASSKIEGRNARLSDHYFSARGVRASHIFSQTTIANFWIKRTDGTTASERLCDHKPPDLFAYLLENLGALPLPRKRKMKILSPVEALALPAV